MSRQISKGGRLTSKMLCSKSKTHFKNPKLNTQKTVVSLNHLKPIESQWIAGGGSLYPYSGCSNQTIFSQIMSLTLFKYSALSFCFLQDSYLLLINI